MSLKGIPTDDLLAELARRKTTDKLANVLKDGEEYAKTQPLVGCWRVTTEGDVEGKSTKDLGLHVGHVVDIAANLAPLAEYALDFTPEPIPKPAPARAVTNRCTVHIRPPDHHGYKNPDERRARVSTGLPKGSPDGWLLAARLPSASLARLIARRCDWVK